MNAREDLRNEMTHGHLYMTHERADELIAAYDRQLANMIVAPETWVRFGYSRNTMVVYMTAAKKVAKMIDPGRPDG